MKGKLKILSFQIVLLLFLLLIVEIVLRAIGYKPGDLNPKWLNFKPVDSLYLVHDFYCNNEGILVADSSCFTRTDLHINEDGFRSPDFARLDSSKKKILFIGDSFAWGMGAKPIKDSCFVDRIRNETNYEVINLGIPAADPVQYFLLAKKYISRFKPDYVFVIFFMGNDLMMEDRQVNPSEPWCYFTNAGAVFTDMDGNHFKSAAGAYNYYANEKYFLHKPANAFEWVISKSALLSRLYSLRFRIQEKIRYEHVVKHTEVTKKYLNGIRSIAALYHTPLKFVLVPEIKEADMSTKDYEKKYSDLLNDGELKDYWLIPANSKSNFNDYPDGHLSNKGQRHYADYLEGFLNKR